MFEHYSGATRLIPILGHPIAQAKSPFGMTKALSERGIDAIVVPVDVPPASVEALLRSLDAVGNLAGVIATVPHKFALCAHAAERTARASFFGSANVMRRRPDGAWLADMLDGIGFVRAIQRAGGTVAGKETLLVGAGGAGGAIAFELLNAGAASIAIHDTDTERRDRLVTKLNHAHPGKARNGTASPVGYGVVVNATPLGLRAADPPPLDVARLEPAMFVGDVVTGKADTALIAAAKAAGCRCNSGHDMFEMTLDLMIDFFNGGEVFR
jgi:shikimate dehydrogenase